MGQVTQTTKGPFFGSELSLYNFYLIFQYKYN